MKNKLRMKTGAVQYICENAMTIEQFVRLPEATQDNIFEDPEHACMSFDYGFTLADFLTFSEEMQDTVLNCDLDIIEFIAELYHAHHSKDPNFLHLLLDENVIQDIDHISDLLSSLGEDEFKLAIDSTLASLYMQQSIKEINVAVLRDALFVAKTALHQSPVAQGFFTPKKQIRKSGDHRDCESLSSEKRTRTPSPVPVDPLARDLFGTKRITACTPEPNQSPNDRGPSV